MASTRPPKFIHWLGLLVISALVVCIYSSVKLFLNEQVITTELRHLGGLAPVWFMVVFTLALSVGLPGNVLAIAGGAVFGITWGTVWSLLGGTFGAVIAFLLARYCLHGWVERHFGSHPLLQRLNRAIAHSPFTFVVATRFTPLSPFSLVNFLFGLTPIDLRTYTVGTFVGLIPLTLAYSWLGKSGYTAFHGGNLVPLYWAFGLLTVLSVLPVLVKKSSS